LLGKGKGVTNDVQAVEKDLNKQEGKNQTLGSERGSGGKEKTLGGRVTPTHGAKVGPAVSGEKETCSGERGEFLSVWA